MPTRIETHAFTTTTRERAAPLLTAAIDNLGANRGHEAEARAKNRARMNVGDHYLEAVFRRTLGVLATIEVLYNARRMIKTFPTQLGRGAHGLTRDRWIDYHYGYFTVSLASVLDVSFLLAAAVLRIGLAPKHCTPTVLLAHAAIKGSAVAPALKELRKLLQPATERRNIHLHRAEHAAVADLDQDGFLRNMMLFAAVPDAASGSRNSELVHAAWREAVKRIVFQLDREVEQVEDALAKVFDALLSRFTRTHDSLRRLSSEQARR